MITSPAPELVVCADRDAMARSAVERFIKIAEDAIAARGLFSVALSGGSTPGRMYEGLASEEFKSRVDWKRILFFWGDERAVAPDDPQSNYRMADETLLSHVPAPRENIHRILAEKPPPVAALEYEETLGRFRGNTIDGFDLVLLGLGTNGHTASLFPHTAALHEETRACVAVWVAELDANRITLTAPVLNRGANVIFLVSGRDKSAVLQEVMQGPYDPERLPAQLIRPANGKLVWLVDRDAASGMKRET